ncbi:MAG: glycosyltransferase family 39 protein [Solirubrobacterales bacterium]|nr:glycosyltransferase family 39 protein [Solirubrobacterales bacterium]
MRLVILFSILLFGLLLRADSAWQGAERNLPDSAAYERIAIGLHDRGQFDQGGRDVPAHPQAASNYSPGLPLLIAGWFDLTGENARTARLMLALISSLSIPLAWMLAGRLAPPSVRGPAEITAAAVAAFYPTVIADAGMFLTEPLAGTLIVGALLSMLKADEAGSQWAWIPPGILFGLTAMVRPEYLAIGLAAVAALFLAPGRRSLRPTAGPALIVVLSFVAIVAPWLITTSQSSGRPIPISTGAGQTLFTGSIQSSGGNPQEVAPAVLGANPALRAELLRQNRVSGEAAGSITPERIFSLLAERRFPGLPTDLALARMGRDNYLRALESDPVGLAGFLTAKSIRVWWRGRRDLTGSIPGRFLHWLIVALAAGGLALLARRRRPELWPILALTVGATVVGAILVASPRRSLALWPLIAALSGVGLAGAISLADASLARRRGPVASTGETSPLEPETPLTALASQGLTQK